MEKKVNRLNKEEREFIALSSIEAKRRLKHIARLCYSLCCDISNMEIQTEDLKARIKELEYELSQRSRKRKMTPEQAERHRQVMREYYEKNKDEINAKARAKRANQHNDEEAKQNEKAKG